MRLGFLACLLVSCSTEELVDRPDAGADTPSDTSHPDVVFFDAPFEVRPPVDAGDETIVDVCSAYCACMKRTCTSYAGYPYADETLCLGVCAAFSEKERTCWSQSCRTAEMYDVPSVREHLCQHAWGTFGLNECAP